MQKTVLITGGSSGIGAAMVREFAGAGYRVWFTYRTGRDRAERLMAALAEKETAAFHLVLDDRDSHRALVDALPGPVDILVNNAGLGSKTVERVADSVPEQDAALLSVNALGALWLARALLPGMLERGSGKIVLISSVLGGITQFPDFHVADGMSNAALAHMGKQLQARHVRDPIDVFTICPGATDTPMFEASTLGKLDAAARRRFIDGLPDRRLIEPAEIARLAVWLCTDDARILRGAVLDASLGMGAYPALPD